MSFIIIFLPCFLNKSATTPVPPKMSAMECTSFVFLFTTFSMKYNKRFFDPRYLLLFIFTVSRGDESFILSLFLFKTSFISKICLSVHSYHPLQSLFGLLTIPLANQLFNVCLEILYIFRISLVVFISSSQCNLCNILILHQKGG